MIEHLAEITNHGTYHSGRFSQNGVRRTLASLMWVVWVAFSLLGSLSASRVWAQAPGEAPPADPRPAITEKDFPALMAKFKEQLSGFSKVRQQLETVSPAEAELHRQRLMALYNSLQALESQLTFAAEQAVARAPQQYPEAPGYLRDVALTNLESGRPADALRQLKLLANLDKADPNLHNLIGEAALGVGDFPTAILAFGLAEKAGVLSPSGKQSLQEIQMLNSLAPDLPQVLLKTSKGDVIVELFEDEAPNTVANFISLVEKKYYDGLTFHRVLENFMAQGGCPNGSGTGGPGYSIRCECQLPKRHAHLRGALSMAHAGQNTGGSQFFITFVSTPHLDGKHTVFGRVIQGMENVDRLQKIDPSRRNDSVKPDKILSASVIRKRNHAYQPETLPSAR